MYHKKFSTEYTCHGSLLPPTDADSFQICYFVAIRDTSFDSRYDMSIPMPGVCRDSKRDLAHLRLASRTTCESADPHFFKNVDANPARLRKMSVATWRRSLLAFRQRPWVKYVRKIDVIFSDSSGQNRLQGAERREILVASAYTIPSFVRSCKRLSALDFQVRSHDLVTDSKEDRSWSRCILLMMIENSLQECTRRLTSLKIRLPLAFEFGALERSIRGVPESLTMMSRLDDLDVAITDASGPGVSRYNSSPESDDHREFPNQQYQAAFWRFVHLATALKTLSVSCTHILNLGLLPKIGTRFLQELYLSKVEVPWSRLENLVGGDSVGLRAVQFWCVELTSGRWSDVLLKFCEMPQLIAFHMDSCGYSSTGAASHRRLGLFPEPDNPQAIETSFVEEDFTALGALQRHVNGLRADACLPLFTEYDFRYLNWT